MARKLFKPGQSGNPGGRPRDTQRFREIKKLTREQVEQLGALILSGNTQELQKIAQDPNSSVLQVWIASGSIHGIKKGDLNAMNALLDRIIGRIPAPIEFSGPDQKPIEIEVKRRALIELGKNADVMKLLDHVLDSPGENE